AALPERLPGGVAGQDLHVLLLRGVGGLALDERLGEGVELAAAGFADHVRVGHLASSSSSGFVKAVWAGPRRPSTTISVTFDSASTSSAWSATSVCASSSRVRASMRATSVATFPFPTTIARSALRSNSRSR